MSKPKNSPRARFGQQRRAARQRGIEWQLSFEQWWDIWSSSGVYALRGCGIGKYVMARNGDIGPYAVGNVRIALWRDNLDEGPKKLGSGRGWTYRTGIKNPFQVVANHKYIGCFPTAAAAEEAYRNACL